MLGLASLDAIPVGPKMLWAVAGNGFDGIKSAVKAIKGLVGVRGFEPPAPASRTQCSTRLSYTPAEGGRIAAPRAGGKALKRTRDGLCCGPAVVRLCLPVVPCFH